MAPTIPTTHQQLVADRRDQVTASFTRAGQRRDARRRAERRRAIVGAPARRPRPRRLARLTWRPLWSLHVHLDRR